MADELTLAEIVRALRRQRRLAVGVTLAGMLLGGLAALLWPASYTATARLLVESQQIPADLARSTVTAGPAERLGLIEERLMTRANLLAVADRLGLFADRPSLSPGERVEAMRRATRIEPVALARQARRGEPATALAFTIRFSAPSAAAAARAANEFASRLHEQNQRERTSRASETNAFLKQELARLAEALAEAEGALGAYKKANAGALPDGLELRRRELLDLRSRAFAREERRIELRGELRQIADSLAAGPARPAETPEARELAGIERRLAERGAVLSPSHPEIRALEARAAALRPAVARAAAGPGGAEEAMRRLRQAAERAEGQLALLAEQEQADRRRRDALEAANARTPAIEAGLARLERRLADLQAQHGLVVRKQAEAATGEQLELGRQAERVEVIEPASLPERRDGPGRLPILAGGTAAGLALGLTLALLAEFAGGALRDPEDLERRLGLTPLAVIPVLSPPRRLPWRRLAAAVLALAAAGGLLVPGEQGRELRMAEGQTPSGLDDG